MNKKRFFKTKTALAFFMVLFSLWGWGQGTLAITRSNFPSGTGYTTSTWTATSSTGEAITGTSRLFLTTTANIQIGGAETPHPYNSTAIPGAITKIEIKMPGSGSLRAWTPRVSATAAVTSATGGAPLSSQTFTSNTGTLSWNLNASDNIKYFYLQAGGNTNIASIIITYEIPSAGSTITATPNSLTECNYVEGSGPSAEKSFTLSGSNLTGDITAAAPTGFEISKTSGTDYVDNLSFAPTSGTVASTTVYARLMAGLAPNSYSGNIVLASTGATAINVALSGTVSPMTVKPVITAPAPQTGTVGVPYSYQIVASANPISYAIATGSLPAGLNLNTSTGVISGTPTQAGTFNTTLTATNAAGPSDVAAYEITVDKGTQTVASLVNVTKNLSDGTVVFPANSDNAALPISYSSSDETVATVSGNTVTFLKVGTLTITASQAGDGNWNSFEKQITLTINADPIPYYGSGKFVKISTSDDLTDGYYVVANETDEFLMTNVNSGYFVSEELTPVSGVIQNPSVNNVWVIKSNGGGRTIFNESTGKFVGWTSGNSASAEDAPANSNRWIFSYSSNKFTVNNVGTPARQLSYNSASPRFAAYGNANQEELQLYKLVSTSWDGTAWSNGIPDVTKEAIIYADYTGDSFTSKSITVNEGVTLTVPANGFVKTGIVTNNGNIMVADNANFVQTGDFTPGANSSFKVNRTSKDISRLDYISWSSPMDNSPQTLKAFSPQTLDARFLTYNNGLFVKVANPNVPFNKGQGYLIRTPNNFSVFPAVQKFNGVFEGTKPNAGIVQYDTSVITGEFVFVGNPYPSAISMESFYDANPQIDGSFYIWDSAAAKMDADGKYSGSNYVTHTSTGSVPAGSESFVPVSQGFFINRGTSDDALIFNDGMRQTTETGSFAKISVNDKFWLQMTAPSGSKPQMLIGFNENATSGYDKGLDAKMLDQNADVIYSTIGSQSLIINTLGSFSTSDVINVTPNFLAAGNYTISIAQKKGIFTNGQHIYLKDNVTGAETEISAGDYNFAATAGFQADRFTLYFSTGLLANSNATKGQSTIYADHQVIFVKGASKIGSVEVYDMSGKLMKTTKNVNAENISFPVAYQGIAVVRLILNNGEVVTKKVILK